MADERDFELLDSPIPRWDYDAVSEVLAAKYGLQGELSPLDGERDQNLLLDSPEGRFMVKIANPAEAIDVLDMQQAALEHVRRWAHGFAVPQPRRSNDGRRVVVVERSGVAYPVRVQTFLDGAVLRGLPAGTVTPRHLGEVLAALQLALQGFFHPAAGRRLLWDVRLAPELHPMLSSIGEPEVRSLVEAVLEPLEAEVLPGLGALPSQIIHNDVNPDNILVTGDTITGIIDFGDLLHGPRVMDLAVAAAYVLPDAADSAEALADLCAGYHSLIELSGEELEVLPDLVAGRLCLSIAIGEWRAERHPDNAEYILGDARPARWALGSLLAEDRAGLVDRLSLAVGRPPLKSSGATAEVQARRQRALAPGLRLSYRAPLHLVSGEGVWLHAADGRRYLDAYNNVVQVGHGHPLIARTLAEQTRRLNTNTRYLTDEVVAYAERLTALLPDGLDVCYFTNSGSEATDLAWRIARTVTGNDGIVISEHAYHGGTTAVMAFSPEELRSGALEPWVATVPPPGDHDPAGAVEQAVAMLRREVGGPAALMFDTIFSSDGIHDPARSYLDASAAGIRAAGGLFIADEVQAGLGRVGQRFWGFAAGTAVPDIVTLGKPIGNGHPIGVVITSKEIAERFAELGYFFSTFGGNPVSAAVGNAVLDITFAEALPKSADSVGEYLRTGLAGMAATSDVLGGVRGAGLFVGVDVVDTDGGPDEGRARAMVEAMRDNGVLIGRTGRHENVLKIRPPLIFEHDHADLLLDSLSAVLGG